MISGNLMVPEVPDIAKFSANFMLVVLYLLTYAYS